jgi:hypothetical protein
MIAVFSGIAGMTEMNGKSAAITVIDVNSFSVPINSTAYHTYVSGGFVGPDDGMLDRLITAASEDIRQETSRIFDIQDYVEIRSGTGGKQVKFLTKQWPINSVDHVTVDGQDIAPSTGFNQPGYTFTNYDSAGHITLISSVFNRGVDNIEVGYNAGFNPIPHDLEQACIDLVAYRFTSRGRIGHKSKSLAGEVVAFVTDHYPDPVMRVIQRYKRTIPL